MGAGLAKPPLLGDLSKACGLAAGRGARLRAPRKRRAREVPQRGPVVIAGQSSRRRGNGPAFQPRHMRLRPNQRVSSRTKDRSGSPRSKAMAGRRIQPKGAAKNTPARSWQARGRPFDLELGGTVGPSSAFPDGRCQRRRRTWPWACCMACFIQKAPTLPSGRPCSIVPNSAGGGGPRHQTSGGPAAFFQCRRGADLSPRVDSGRWP